MKKLFVAALLMLGVATMAQAIETQLTDSNPSSVYLSSTAAPGALAITGAGVVYGVQCASGAVTNFLVLSDSNTLNTTTEGLMPRFMLITSAPQTFTFPKPVRIVNGLVARMAASTQDAYCSVFYRKGRL
jgi:hypothetical protein